MGKDRRKKDSSRKQATTAPATSNVLTEPRNRDKEAVKQPDPTPAPVETGPPDTAELFANLKRETDEIKALNTKKFPRRQITSNWEHYNEPLPTPEYEVGLQGADFESLVHAPMSEGGHFQFKSERSWDSNIEALSGELFSLDVDYLADGLATIPLYLQLDLPVTFLSVTQREEMDDNAKQCVGHYESVKKNISRKRDKRKGGEVMDVTAGRILDILMMKEPSPAPAEESSTDKKMAALTFDIAEPDIQDTDQNTKMSDAEQTGGTEVSHNVERNSPTVSSDDQVATAPEPVDHKSKPTNRAVNPPAESVVDKSKPGNKTVSSRVQSADQDVSVVETSNEAKVEEAAQSWTEEPGVPLDQRSVRRKPRGKTQPPERHKPKEEKPKVEKPKVEKPKEEKPKVEKSKDEKPKVEKPKDEKPKVEKPKEEKPKVEKPKEEKSKVEKPKADDDLDLLLSLKKPVRESPALQLSQVTKPTIDDDDAADSSQLPLLAPQKQTEDLEDWLDSMLDD